MLERLDPPVVDILTYSLFALSAYGAPPDRVTDMVVHNIAAQQHADGSWGSFGGIVRPPLADGKFSVTAVAIRALSQYAPPARKAEMEGRIQRAAEWLTRAEPRTTEDSIMQLLGAKWAGMDRAMIDSLAARILALQREDGAGLRTDI